MPILQIKVRNIPNNETERETCLQITSDFRSFIEMHPTWVHFEFQRHSFRV